jgi:hypothetical protein
MPGDIHKMGIPILFVNEPQRRGGEDEIVREPFCEALEPDFTADFYFHFGGHILELIDRNLARDCGPYMGKYRAIVTHFPYDFELRMGYFSEFKGREFYERAYSTSSYLIRKLKSSHPDFPVILYTGIYYPVGPQESDPDKEMIEKFLTDLGIDGFVFKGKDLLKDVSEVKRKLHAILG